jgi:hypothetical protein
MITVGVEIQVFKEVVGYRLDQVTAINLETEKHGTL